MSKERAITYSLLAHINNNEQGIIDLSDIFVPLVKRSIARLEQNGITKGIIDNIKEQVDEDFQLDIPYPILRKIVYKIAKDINSEKLEFQFYKDGSFILHDYIFANYEEIIIKQEAEIETLDLAYNEYLKSNNLKIEEQPTIFEFIDQNRMSLSGFFSSKVEATSHSKYVVQANFINTIKAIQQLYDILRKIYLGSIISSYLEIDYGKIDGNSIEFLLDTNFIMSLLDLSSPESTHTCRKIIEICKRLGYGISALDYTLEEARELLDRTAENYEKYFIVKQINPESIFNACSRRKLKKTDLQQISSRLISILQNDYGIYVITNNSYLQNKARYSEEYSILKNRKFNPDGAFHDAMAIIYVKVKRKKRIKTFYEANCWFVSFTKQEPQLQAMQDGCLSEMIKPEDLVNVLWLSNPNVKGSETTDIGLTRLVSGTISNSLPNPRVLKEFDDNLRKYAEGKISPSDCIILSNRIANKTLTNLEQLNKVAKEKPDEFIKKLNDEVEKVKDEETKKSESIDKLIKDLFRTFDEKLFTKEKELRENYKKDLKRLEEGHRVELEKQINKLDKHKEDRLGDLISTYSSLSETKACIERKAIKYLKRWVIGLFVAYYLILVIGILFLGIEFLNIINFIIPIFFFPISYLLIAIKENVWNPLNTWSFLKKWKCSRELSKSSFSIVHYNDLSVKIENLKNELKVSENKKV